MRVLQSIWNKTPISQGMVVSFAGQIHTGNRNSSDWLVQTVSPWLTLLFLANSSSLTNPLSEQLRFLFYCVVNCNLLASRLCNALLQLGDVTSLILFNRSLGGGSSRQLLGVDGLKSWFAVQGCRIFPFFRLISRGVGAGHDHICGRAHFFGRSMRPSGV